MDVKNKAYIYFLISGKVHELLDCFFFILPGVCAHIYRVRTDPGKVWKVLEFNVEIFKALKQKQMDQP